MEQIGIFNKPKKMNVLVACEESQRVCIAFRDKGHNAFSCDIQECSGGHPEWHIQGDVLSILNPTKIPLETEGWHTKGIKFTTTDGKEHFVIKWDLIIAHPPCTDLCVSGARHFERKRANGSQAESIEFFAKFLDVDCERVCVENPVGIISGNYLLTYFPELAEKYNLPRQYSQIIQPYYFGDFEKKTTCLWLKGLPKLEPTNIVEPNIKEYICKDGKIARFSEAMVKTEKGIPRAKTRSKTFEGIARAMAEQWG